MNLENLDPVENIEETENGCLCEKEAEQTNACPEEEEQARDEKLKTLLEGVLFGMGESVSRENLAEVLEVSVEAIDEAAARLAAMYEERGSGIRLVRLEDSYRLCAAKECYEPLIRLTNKPKDPTITNVVLETLAIIAYKQPVTKADIEKIRGVSSDHAVNRLVEYGLVEEAGRLDAPGRPILFRTTEAFLRRFGLSSPDELPAPTADQLVQIAEEVEAQTASDAAQEAVNVEV